MLQDKCDHIFQISEAGELIFKAQYMYCTKFNTNWYWKP